MVFQYIGLPALLARGEAAALAATNEGANKLVQLAETAAPRDEGTLGGSIHTDGARMTGRGAEAHVQTGAEASSYAVAQHEGAKPHVIKPKNGQALYWPGAAHPVKEVNHPGNPATKFLEGPLLTFAPRFVAVATAAMRKAY